MAKQALWVANFQCNWDKPGRRPSIQGAFTVAATKATAEQVMMDSLLMRKGVSTVEVLEPAQKLDHLNPGQVAVQMQAQGLTFVVPSHRIDKKILAALIESLLK
jgi:hypothetical protein